MLPGLIEFLIEPHQLGLAPTAFLVGELDGLLGAGDLGADGVIAPLDRVEVVGSGVVRLAFGLDLGLQPPLFGQTRFALVLGLGQTPAQRLEFIVERAPAQRLEFQIQTAFLGAQLGVFLGRRRLTLQMQQLFADFLAHVVEPVEILARMAHPVLGLAPTLLVLGDPRRLFQKQPQILRTRLDDARDHPLLDDGVGTRPESGAEEQILDVAPPAAGAVQEVAGLTVARDLTLDRDLIEGRVLAPGSAVAVVEDQLDARHADRLAPGAAIEDDVGHGLAAQHLGRGLAHHPAHGVDDVGFAAAVRADDADQIARKVNGRGIDEGFEAGELDALESHG